MNTSTSLTTQMAHRAKAINASGGIDGAMASGRLPKQLNLSLAEAIVLGLLRQGVKNYIGIFGHGSTQIGEVLRIYEAEGLVKMYNVRHETEAVHAATALNWVRGEKSAVVTSIGPGALHVLAGSLAPASNGIGVWFLLGDETTQDEGPNMQQIPGHDQNGFHRLFSAMGKTYTLHTPQAIGTALRRGLAATQHPYRSGPFFLLMPMNTQAAMIQNFNLDELPDQPLPQSGPAGDDRAYEQAVQHILRAKKILVKIGGGGRGAGSQLLEFLSITNGVAVTSPLVPGVIPFFHPQNMTIGGSKGSLSGNFAMAQADLLIAVGTRFVCQSDCSRTGYPNLSAVITINADPDTAIHYSKNTPLVGDAALTLERLNVLLAPHARQITTHNAKWRTLCTEKRREWDTFRQERYLTPCLYDPMWKKKVLTQPAAIKTATDWARENQVISFFDAGDVQANGFQIVEDDCLGQTYTETGASYMGFAVCALMATAMAKVPFYGLALSGDGSFVMNPQILIDGVYHGATGCILLLDNRRMAAISGLQKAQYGVDYATWDRVEVDYMAWAGSVKGVAVFEGGDSTQDLKDALSRAKSHDGLSLVYVRVYSGDDPLGAMGVFGRWNVGPWCTETQALRHDIGI